MKLLAKLRSRHLPLARALVALFAIGWLGLALQPCQAMGTDENGHAGHQDGMEHSSMPAGCDTPSPYCPSDRPDVCEAKVALDCETIGVPSTKADASTLDAKYWHAPATYTMPDIAFPQSTPDWPDPSRHRAPSSSFQQRYCTYLK